MADDDSGSDPTGGLLSAGGDIVSAGIGYVGQQQTNAANLSASMALQQQNEGFQEYMSDTAHQREVADLKAAGLNPILSATGGGGAGGGSAAQSAPEITSPSEAIASSAKSLIPRAVDLMGAKGEADTKVNTAKLVEAQTAKAKNEADISGVEARLSRLVSKGLDSSGVGKDYGWSFLKKILGYQPDLKKPVSPKLDPYYNSEGVSKDGHIDPRRKP